MAEPKISVLIPMYNRKHYISDAIDSVLRQTFQDFEIIIRDNCSTDGSFEFVQEKYAVEISSGKIKLARNLENLGEFGNDARLIINAQGEYFNILHSDDLLASQALEHLYTVAKKNNADVVHSSFQYGFKGNFTDTTELKFKQYDTNPAQQVLSVPYEQVSRFIAWYTRGIGVDAQFNLFNTKFIVENEIFSPLLFNSVDLFTLNWIMKAKTVIKTPMPFYIYRESPDSQSIAVTKSDAHEIGKHIARIIEESRQWDKLLPNVELFKNAYFRRCAKIWLFNTFEWWHISRANTHKGGISSELFDAIDGAFRNYFGDDAEYPMFLFHLLHSMQCGTNILQASLHSALNSLEKSAPPRFRNKSYSILEAA